MLTMSFRFPILRRFCSFLAFSVILTILIGCAGGEPEPLPGTQPTAGQDAPPPAAEAPATPEPPAVQEAIQLHGQAETAVKSALSELQAVKTPQDFQAKLPAIKKHLDAMLDHIEQADAKLSSLDAERKAELERRFVADSTLPATFQQIGGEVTRITQTGGIGPEVLADFMGYMLQFNQRAAAIVAKAKGGGAGVGANPPVENQEGTNGGTAKE